MIAPWYRYAECKVRDHGGTIDEWVATYHQKRRRMSEILVERRLDPTTTSPLGGSIGLVEAGVLPEIARDAHHYGVADVVGLYEKLHRACDETKELLATMLLTTPDRLQWSNKNLNHSWAKNT